MTRINTTFPMIDEHLRAARREYPRIAAKVIELVENNALYRLESAPKSYTVRTENNPNGGKGHMLFFYNKLKYVHDQYQAVRAECARRGFVGGKFKNADLWPYNVPHSAIDCNGDVITFWNDYIPTYTDVNMCKTRLIERIPIEPHHNGKLISRDDAILLILNS